MHVHALCSKFLIAFLILALFIPLVDARTFTAKSGLTFVTSSNNSYFVLGKDYTFSRIKVNTTHLELDREYTLNNYGYFTIWSATSNEYFQINEWFPASGTTHAKLSVSTVATFYVYSPQWSSVTVTGSSSYSYDSVTRIVTITGWGAIRIDCGVTPTYYGTSTPDILSADIPDHDEGGVLYTDKYYSFITEVWDGDSYLDIETIELAFYEGPLTEWHNITYTVATDSAEITTGEDVTIEPATFTVDASLNSITLTVSFSLGMNIFDTVDMVLYVRAIDEGGLSSGWVAFPTDYLIYNLGGQSVLTYYGDAGRLVGGDVFQLYAGNSSWAMANVTWKNLQHLRTQMRISIGYNSYLSDPDWNQSHLQWRGGFDFLYDDEWRTGWSYNITLLTITLNANTRICNYQVQWYYNNIYVKNENLSSLAMWAGTDATSPIVFTVWLDLWYNKINASSIIGGRINSQYWGVINNAAWWANWWSTNWGAVITNSTNSLLFTELDDGDGNTISAMSVGLTRAWMKVINNNDVATDHISIDEFNIFEWTFAYGQMMGVNTPPIERTVAPDIVNTGIGATLNAAFSTIASSLSQIMGKQILSFFSYFVSFMDTIASWLGHPGAFTSFTTTLNNYWAYMVTGMGYIWSMVIPLFTGLSSMMVYGVSLLTTSVSIMQSMITEFSNIVTGVGYGGVNLWNEFGGNTWLTLFIVLYPMWLLFLWEEKGGSAVIGQITFIINVFSFVFGILLDIVQFVLNLVFRIIEAIPVAE